MNKTLLSLLIVGLAIFAFSCQPAAPADLSQADKDAVKATIDKYVQASISADWDAWGSTLAADVVVSPPNLAPITGRQAAVAWIKTFPKISSFTVNVEEVTGRGDLAFARGTYAVGFTLADGSAATDRGSFLEVHRRQADGMWPYTHLMFHSTDPLPPVPPTGKK